MLKRLIIFSFLYLAFSFSHASIVDPDKGKDHEKEQKCKKKQAVIERENDEHTHYIKQVIEEDQPENIAEEKKQEQKDNVHSFNFLYYLIHHYKFSDFITK